MVFDPYFFVAEKPSPMMPTCTVVNFHNLHSILGLFGSWFLNRRNQVTGVGCRISCRRKSQLVVSYQVVTDPCCGLSVIFCGFISQLIGRETINIPEIFASVHGFMGKTVIPRRRTQPWTDCLSHKFSWTFPYFYDFATDSYKTLDIH